MRASVPTVAVITALAAGLVSTPRGLGAQIPANEDWHTISTRHFRLHYTTGLEAQARHAAAVAERAYSNLASELVAPRGLVDVVLSDGTDASNGSATVIPRPVITMYARPPVDEPSLESYDDWSVLVLQHELTHIFHLDRSRGWWRAAQFVFGRNPVLFPNYYTPAWLTEGLAVYYESRFTRAGRLHGSFESSVARAAAIDQLLPNLGQLSLATSRFPYGQSVYVYGSFVWDELARRHGAETVPAFVERSSVETIPFLLDREAKRTFGETFTHAWNQWRDSTLGALNDSVALKLQTARTPSAFASSRAVVIPDGGGFIVEPRWLTDSSLVFVANNGRESPGLYVAREGATPLRVARRNSLDVNDPTDAATIVYSQGEYLDRFHARGDLYSSGVNGSGEERLTTGARLSAPSVRADGEIVAVQTVPGSTRLVRVSRDGRVIVPITSAPLDSQWSAPRWSPDGKRIAAVVIAGGRNAIAVLDSAGRRLSTPVRQAAVIRSPAWLPSGNAIVFTSDSSSESQLWVVGASARSPNAGARRLTAEAGGLYGVDVMRSRSDSVRFATTALRGDGYHVLVWTVGAADLASVVGSGAAAERAAAPQTGSVASLAPIVDPRWAVVDDTSAARSYSPWRTLIPAYWSPTFAQVGNGRGDLIGALTSASDVVGRHAYVAQASVNTHNRRVDASLGYAYSRWINPVLSASLEQSWTYSNITGNGVKIGDLERRSRIASLHATFARPRVRTYSAFTIGAEFEERIYDADPQPLLPRLPAFYLESHRYPTLVASGVFSNTQTPRLSISPEDGVRLAASIRQRWESSAGISGRSAVIVGSGYKSLDLPGFAHHVIAVRAALGSADRRSPSEYAVGGVSGSSFQIVPGISFGSAARTFPVRGFPSGAETGVQASAASVEYRLPLVAPGRSLGLFPFFLDRTSMSFFSDAARAFCPARATPACAASAGDGPTLSSVGAELNLDSALQFDVPYRFRLGLAHPISGAAYADASSVSAFATLGIAF